MAIIKGRVVDTEVNEGVGFIRVELRSYDGIVLQVSATDSEGTFEFRDVEPKRRYVVVALSPIHVPAKYAIRPEEIIAGKTTRIELRTHKVIL